MILTLAPDTKILSDRLRACAERVRTATTGFTTPTALAHADAELAAAAKAIDDLRAGLRRDMERACA